MILLFDLRCYWSCLREQSPRLWFAPRRSLPFQIFSIHLPLKLQLNKLMKMVEELESTPYSMGENSTSFWLREFINYRQYFAAEDEQSFYVALKSFLKISFNKQWNSFLQWAPNQTTNKVCPVVAIPFQCSYIRSNMYVYFILSGRKRIRTEILLYYRVQNSRLECTNNTSSHLAEHHSPLSRVSSACFRWKQFLQRSGILS